MQRFRGGLVFKAHRLCVSLTSRLESNKEEECQVSKAPLATRSCPSRMLHSDDDDDDVARYLGFRVKGGWIMIRM